MMSIREHRRSPKDLSSLPDILAALSSLEVEETTVSTDLTDLVASNEPVDAALANLKSLSPQFSELGHEAVFLSDKVSSTAYTADRIGGRVRSLDEQMRRVREANERVAQVLELKVGGPYFLRTRNEDNTDNLSRPFPLCTTPWRSKTGKQLQDSVRVQWPFLSRLLMAFSLRRRLYVSYFPMFGI